MAPVVRIGVHESATCPDLDDLAAIGGAEGHSFVQRTIDEWRSGENRFDLPNEAFFIAVDAGDIVGMCGLNVDPFAGDPRVGRLRHLYVLPRHRRRGIGRGLVDACVRAAEDPFDRLRLRTFDPAAAAFYVAVGFTPVSEEHATHAIDFERVTGHGLRVTE